MTAADLDGTGACSPNACARTQIRKVNLHADGANRESGDRQPVASSCATR